jgi:hypothetical protein
MKLLLTLGITLMLAAGCSITVIHYGDRDPEDGRCHGDWGWHDSDDTDVVTPDGSGTATTKPNPELKKKLLEQLKGLEPILTKEYNSLLASKPNLNGIIVMRMTVSGEGRLKGLNVISNTTGDEKLASLLEQEIRKLKLDTGTSNVSDVVFDIPFHFADGVGSLGITE